MSEQHPEHAAAETHRAEAATTEAAVDDTVGDGAEDAPAPADDAGTGQARVDLPRTGVPAVDAVLERVDAVAERDVDEHVAVFERAHEDLRRALDGSGDTGA